MRSHMTLKSAGFLILLGASLVAHAESLPYPEEVKAFITERETCDHFRGEPFEGNSPEQVERRNFIADSLDISVQGRTSASQRSRSGIRTTALL